MTTDMHKAPSVARNTCTSGDNETSVARYDLSTSEGGRRYIAGFFATELRRHDFERYINTHLAADFACALAQHLAATGKQQVSEMHRDDAAVDAFADAMKAKMADARAKGRGGWKDPAQCSSEDLSRMLRDHVEKGDPRDVANFCMMLHQRREAIAARQQMGQEPVGYWFTDDPAVYAMPGSGFHSGKEPPADAINVVPVYAAQTAQDIDLRQFRDRIKAAIDRIVNHQCLMRIPVDNTDPDIVLADILRLIDAQLDAAPAVAA